MSVFKPFVQMSPEEIRGIVNNRELYIWGMGATGLGLCNTLKRNGFTVSGFIDSNPILHGTEKNGVLVSSPQDILSDGVFDKIFVITAMGLPAHRKEASTKLEKCGGKAKTDYIEHNKLCNYFPSIDISGACNLKCIACPRGSGDYFHGKPGFMSLEDYRAVAEKLLREIPMVGYVSLFIWGEPFIHPQLPEIIKINKELGIADQISTNLNYGKNLEEIVAAGPMNLNISCSGYGPKNYEITHTGGKWDEFYKNLVKLSELIKKYDNKTAAKVYYHVNNENFDEYPKILALCDSLGFPVSITSSRLFPDYALRYEETGEITPEAKLSADLMPISFDEMLKNAKETKDKVCTMSLAFPNINWDRKAYTCCNLGTEDFIADDFLTVSLEDLTKLRNKSDLCRRCIKTSVYRYYETQKTYQKTVELIDKAMKNAINQKNEDLK